MANTTCGVMLNQTDMHNNVEDNDAIVYEGVVLSTINTLILMFFILYILNYKLFSQFLKLLSVTELA